MSSGLKNILWLCILLALYIGTFNQVEAYRNGDIVRMSKRSATKQVSRLQFDEQTAHHSIQAQSQWTEIIGKHCPRYTWKKKIKLPLSDPDQFDPNTNPREFKMQVECA